MFLKAPELPGLCTGEIEMERISYVRGSRGRLVVILKGGDTTLCRSMGAEPKRSESDLKKLNPEKLKIIQALVKKIHAGGAKAYLLFQPIAPGKTINTSAVDIRAQTGVDGILDLGAVGEKHSDWGDVRHLNFRGRREFTLKFAEEWKLMHSKDERPNVRFD
jgi:hypothetical protein